MMHVAQESTSKQRNTLYNKSGKLGFTILICLIDACRDLYPDRRNMLHLHNDITLNKKYINIE